MTAPFGRARSRGRALLALSVLSLWACGTTPPASTPAVNPSRSEEVAIPTGELPPKAQCLVDRGFRVVKVEPPQAEWDAPSYVFESDLPRDQALAAMSDCGKLYPTAPKTDQELQAIYERWLSERTCLIELGYQPKAPPSMEQFMSDWRSPRGPWMPIDGVDTGSWSASEYEQAKRACTLEMWDRS